VSDRVLVHAGLAVTGAPAETIPDAGILLDEGLIATVGA
jgi:hypothetical protein